MTVRRLPATLLAERGLSGSWRTVAIWAVALSPIPAFLFSMLLGTYGLAVADVVGVIWSRIVGSADYGDTVYTVLFDIRLPRVISAMLVGMAISVSGAALQGVLRNPLVDPYILGLSSGAAFGAALAIAAVTWLPVQLSAFVFGLLAMGIAYTMARTGGKVPIVSLILSGVITSAIFTALLSIVQMSAHERSLQSIVRWIMGSFNAVTWSALAGAWFLIIAGTVVMIALRWRLNVLALGDDEARSAGMNVERYKAVFIVCAALVSAVSVSIAGHRGARGAHHPAHGPHDRRAGPPHAAAAVGGARSHLPGPRGRPGAGRLRLRDPALDHHHPHRRALLLAAAARHQVERLGVSATPPTTPGPTLASERPAATPSSLPDGGQAPREVILDVEHVSAGYGGSPVLLDVSFGVPPRRGPGHAGSQRLRQDDAAAHHRQAAAGHGRCRAGGRA